LEKNVFAFGVGLNSPMNLLEHGFEECNPLHPQEKTN
jgi:hypothetical protein